jgi:hypothetical protein
MERAQAGTTTASFTGFGPVTSPFRWREKTKFEQINSSVLL